jgi:hypothetical protein
MIKLSKPFNAAKKSLIRSVTRSKHKAVWEVCSSVIDQTEFRVVAMVRKHPQDNIDSILSGVP